MQVNGARSHVIRSLRKLYNVGKSTLARWTKSKPREDVLDDTGGGLGDLIF
jgi:hypothetical protein